MGAEAAARRHGRRLGPTDAVSVLLLAVALGALWLAPTRAFRCTAQPPGQARCEISRRLLGLVPIAKETIPGIARAEVTSWVERSEVQNAGERPRQVSTRVEGLLLADADGDALWRAAESHLAGASLADVAQEVEAVVAGASPDGFVRWSTPWPVLLLATPFLLIATSHLTGRLALALRARGVLAGSAYQLAYWLPTLLVATLLAVAWLVALAGANPPPWSSGLG